MILSLNPLLVELVLRPLVRDVGLPPLLDFGHPFQFLRRFRSLVLLFGKDDGPGVLLAAHAPRERSIPLSFLPDATQLLHDIPPRLLVERVGIPGIPLAEEPPHELLRRVQLPQPPRAHAGPEQRLPPLRGVVRLLLQDQRAGLEALRPVPDLDARGGGVDAEPPSAGAARLLEGGIVGDERAEGAVVPADEQVREGLEAGLVLRVGVVVPAGEVSLPGGRVASIELHVDLLQGVLLGEGPGRLLFLLRGEFLVLRLVPRVGGRG